MMARRKRNKVTGTGQAERVLSPGEYRELGGETTININLPRYLGSARGPARPLFCIPVVDRGVH